MDAVLSDEDVGLPPSPAPAQGAAPTPGVRFATPADTQSTPSAAPPSILSDADVGLPPQQTATSTLSDVAKSGATGAAKGTASAIGLPGDLLDLAGNASEYLLQRGANAFGLLPSGTQPESFSQIAANNRALTEGNNWLPRSQDTNAILKSAGVDYQPQTTAGKYAETMGEFAPFALAGPGSVASKLALGAVVPGVASEYAGQAFQGTPAEPWARAGAAIVAGGLPVLGATAAQKTYDIASPVIAKGLAATGRPAMQERLAGETLLKQAQDPVAFRSALNQSGPDEIIPGSKPTTFQLTGDQGIGQLERGVATNNQAPFLERRQEQQAAASRALGDLQPTGNPTDVSAHLTNQLDAIDASYQKAVDGLRQAAQTRAAEIGTGAGPEAVGADLRDRLTSANEAAKANERKLWAAVDPDGTLANPTAALTAANNQIYGSLSPTARAFLNPVEEKFSNLINGYKPVEPFQTIGDLRSNLAAAMRNELVTNGRTPAYARMSQLMGSVQDTISNAIEHRAAQEAQAVATGAMAPEDAMAARLQQEADEFKSARQQTSARASSATGAGRARPAGSSTVSSTPGAEGQSQRGFGLPAGNQGVQEGAGIGFSGAPSDEAAARIKSATQATRENKQTFGKGNVGEILRPGSMSGEFRLSASAVPAKAFPMGPKGYEAVQNYFKAAGTGKDAKDALETAAMESLRSRIGPDGLLNRKTLDAWKGQYTNALRAMDEVSPGFAKKFDDAAGLSDKLLEMTAKRNALVKAHERSVLGKVMKADSEDEVVNRIGNVMGAVDRVGQMQKLVRATQNSPEAQAGLRKAVADWFGRQVKLETEAGTSGEKQISANKFKKLVSSRESVLSQVFTPEEMDSLRSIAADLDRSNRSVVNKAAGSPGTASDLKAADKAGGHGGSATSFLEALWRGLTTGHMAHGLHGAVAGAGVGGLAYLSSVARKAGLHDINEIIADAVLNPERARQIVRRVPNEAQARNMGGIYRRSLLAVPGAVQSH